MKSKIFTTILLAIIMIFSIQLSAQAVIVSTDKQVESGSGTVTISVTSNQLLGAYTLKLTDMAGLTLVSSAGGEVSADKKTITGSSAEGTKNLGTYTFNVPNVEKDTKYNIKFSITGMETPSLESVADENNTAVLTVKAPVTPTPEPEPKPEPTPDPKPETPPTTKKLEFTSVNETVYATGTVNVRESYSASSKQLGQLKEGDSVKRIGVSKTAGTDKLWWSKVEYNGKTGYVISSKLTTTKPEEPTVEEPKTEDPVEEPKTNDTSENDEVKDGLKSLEIEGITLSPAFSPEVYEYRAIVKKDVSELIINAVAASEGATITIAGNKNLQEGENLITIVVYNAENEVEATYQITTNKSTLDLTDTDNLLKAGTQAAKRNLIIFISILVIAIIALIVVMILKHRNESYEDDYEEDDEEDYQGDKFTNSEETVENVEKETTQEEIEKTKKEKRKGKHF